MPYLLEPVLFNDLVTLRERSGVGSYAQELLNHFPNDAGVVRLSATPAGWPYRLLPSKPSNQSPGKGRLHQLLQRSLTLSLSLAKYSLYHEPDALAVPTKLPTIATVHDLSVTLFPEWHPAHRVERYKRELPRVLEQCRGFLADSHATKRDMIQYWKVPDEKIEVVWLAPRPAFRPMPPKKPTQNYFLYLGTMEPRKNVKGLLRAHQSLPEKIRKKFPLLLAGGSGWGDLPKDCQYLGYVPDEDLVPLLCGATALVYPSFFEGFGLPPLEAMACGVPVITSHAGSLKEVVEENALIVDPNSTEQIAEAMARLAENEDTREEYRAKGLARAAQFSWKAAADQTLQAYRRWSS